MSVIRVSPRKRLRHQYSMCSYSGYIWDWSPGLWASQKDNVWYGSWESRAQCHVCKVAGAKWMNEWVSEWRKEQMSTQHCSFQSSGKSEVWPTLMLHLNCSVLTTEPNNQSLWFQLNTNFLSKPTRQVDNYPIAFVFCTLSIKYCDSLQDKSQ